MATSESEVKGAYFVVARRYFAEKFGDEAVERAIASMPEETRYAMESPFASNWYPEVALRDGFRAVFGEVLREDRSAFADAMVDCTLEGTNRFFRALLSIATPRFFFTNYPTVYKQLRRGPSHVEVSHVSGGTNLRFVDLPYSDDELYQLALIGGMNAVFDVLRRPRPDIELTDIAPTSVALELRY